MFRVPRFSIIPVLAVLALACTLAVSAPAETGTPAPQPISGAASGGATSQAEAALTITVDKSSTQARYIVKEQLVGKALGDVAGTTRDISGSIALDAQGKVVAAQSVITVNVQTLTSDSRNRDRYIKTNSLQSNRFPNATFTVRSIEGLTWPLPASGQAKFKMTGDFELHGVTKPVTWDVTASFDGNTVKGLAKTSVTFAEFNMAKPTFFDLVSLEDTLRLEMDFTANIA